MNKSLRFHIFDRDDHRCQYCGRCPEWDDVRLEVDHIVPKSRGGTDRPSNLVTACFDCNRGKRDHLRTPDLTSVLEERVQFARMELRKYAKRWLLDALGSNDEFHLQRMGESHWMWIETASPEVLRDAVERARFVAEDWFDSLDRPMGTQVAEVIKHMKRGIP